MGFLLEKRTSIRILHFHTAVRCRRFSAILHSYGIRGIQFYHRKNLSVLQHEVFNKFTPLCFPNSIIKKNQSKILDWFFIIISSDKDQNNL